MSDANTEALKIALEALKTCDPGESGGFTYEGTYPSYDKRSVENAIAAIEAVLPPPSVSVNVQASEREKFEKMFGDAINKANISAADMPATVATKLREALWDARAALSQPAVQVPEGFKLVPIDPTQAMRDAGNRKLDELKTEPGMITADRAFYTYHAMLDAAPSPSSKGDSQ